MGCVECVGVCEEGGSGRAYVECVERYRVWGRDRCGGMGDTGVCGVGCGSIGRVKEGGGGAGRCGGL